MKKFVSLMIITVALNTVTAEEIISVRAPSGEIIDVEIYSEMSFQEVLKHVESRINELDNSDVNVDLQGRYVLDFAIPSTIRKASSKRDYYTPVTEKEAETIHFIVHTLATNSWTTLLTMHSKLERSRDKINHVHPLRFLMCIFKDEKAKAEVHSIRERRLIWNKFTEGLFDSLDDEAKVGNLTDEMFEDFAKKLGISALCFKKSVDRNHWDSFVDDLLFHLPRQGDPGRYDQ